MIDPWVLLWCYPVPTFCIDRFRFTRCSWSTPWAGVYDTLRELGRARAPPSCEKTQAITDRHATHTTLYLFTGRYGPYVHVCLTSQQCILCTKIARNTPFDKATRRLGVLNLYLAQHFIHPGNNTIQCIDNWNIAQQVLAPALKQHLSKDHLYPL
jgi:hypothetical protein